MTAEEIKSMRISLGLSVKQAAQIARVSERTWQRYEKGDVRAPDAVVELFLIKTKQKQV